MSNYFYETRRNRTPEVNGVKLPTKWAICNTCRGNGMHSHRLGAITQDEFCDWDRDEIELYFAGYYDETCDVCAGSGKIQVVDRDMCNPKLLKAWDEELEDIAEMDAIQRAEMAMGA